MKKYLLNLLGVGLLASATLLGAPTPINQASLPITINTPGNYIVTQALVATGTDITVTANNVTIDFDGFTLTLPDAAVDGILAQNISNLVVKNGTIQILTPATLTSNGIRVEGTTNVICDSMSFKNTRRGVRAGIRGNASAGNINLQILNSTFDHPSTAVAVRAISIEYSQGIRVDNCIFERIGSIDNGDFAMLVYDTSDASVSNCQFLNTGGVSNGFGIDFAANSRDIENLSVENSSFNNCFGAILFLRFGPELHTATVRNCVGTQIGSGVAVQFFGDGLLVEDSIFESTADNEAALVDIGYNGIGVDSFFPGNDVIIRNSTFINKSARPDFNLIWVMNGEGLLIDTCIFDSNGSGQFPPTPGIEPPVASLHLGSLVFDRTTGDVVPGMGTNVNSARIVNSVFHGASQFAILSETGDSTVPNKNIVVENCSIEGAAQAGIYLVNTESSVIRNCHVKDSTGNVNGLGDGIVLAGPLPAPYTQGAVSRYNEISNCTVANCTGTGILIEAGQQFNFVIDNETFSNGRNGLDNQGDKTNQFLRNASCNNRVRNCTGNIPSSLLGTPGSKHPTLGENSCCDSCK